MKIVVVGGSGLIGSMIANNLKSIGHEVIVASPSRGINSVTGDGLVKALIGTDVVIDVSNSPSFENKAVLEFFETSTRNLIAIEELEGIKHHIILSIVGAEKVIESGYFRAKMAQERLVKLSKVPFTIVRATQFFEFLDSIMTSCTMENKIVVPKANMQPIAAKDVSDILTDVALNQPINGTINIAGPAVLSFLEIGHSFLKVKNENTPIAEDVNAKYYGATLKENALVPEDKAILGKIDLKNWFKTNLG